MADPPDGPEGRAYREIGRSMPAPQGIGLLDSAGKPIAWALMFDDDPSVLGFLDRGLKRFGEPPAATERYMRFPSRKLPDAAEAADAPRTPDGHAQGERCPAAPVYPEGTLLGKVYGRAVKDGKLSAETRRQEDYVEGRFEVSVAAQESLAKAEGETFRLPEELARALVSAAYLGMLDVNPLGSPGGQNDRKAWEFRGRREAGGIAFEGTSDVAGGPSRAGARSDGRTWEHSVTLKWQGWIEMKGGRVTRLLATAEGREKLKWANRRMIREGESDVANLPGGRPIDFDGEVRYGLEGRPLK